MATLEKQEGAFTKAKGVDKAAQREIRFSHYRAVVNSQKIDHKVTSFNLRCKDYVNRLVASTKVAFSSLYDGRYLLCNVHSVPYNSALIEQYLKNEKCPLCEKKEIRQAAEALEKLDDKMMEELNDVIQQALDASGIM